MPELSPRENTAGYEVDPVLRQWICMNVCYSVILVIYLLVKPAGLASLSQFVCYFWTKTSPFCDTNKYYRWWSSVFADLISSKLSQ